MKKGFTLIEMLIVIVIIGILSAVSYPSYVSYVHKGYRTEGKSALLDLAARQERHYAQNYTYANLSDLNVGEYTEQDKYKLNVTDVKKTGFTAKAYPQFGDKKCGALVYKSTGEKSVEAYNGVTGTVNDCW